MKASVNNGKAGNSAMRFLGEPGTRKIEAKRGLTHKVKSVGDFSLKAAPQ